MAQTQLAKSGSVALLIKDGAIGGLAPKQVPNADWLPGSLLRLLLGECHVRPCIPAEYQLSTRRAVGAVAGNLWGCGVRFDDGQEEGGVGAVQLEQTSRGETRVSVVRAGSAAFELLDKTIVDN